MRNKLRPIMIVMTVLLLAGCSTPYTRRVDQLSQSYDHGDLSHEDYLRFVHEAEQWEHK